MPILVLGDVGDRGPDTRGVIELLATRGAVGVRGNHDEWLIRWALRQEFRATALSREMGGEATLVSYGVVGRGEGEVAGQAWRVPSSHRSWLSGLAYAFDLSVMGERYWIAHAGVTRRAPPVELPRERFVPHLAEHSSETRASFLWRHREPESLPRLDRPIIMGHSPRSEPLDLGHVIAVDTGCGTSRRGRLTAVVLPERRFVSAGP